MEKPALLSSQQSGRDAIARLFDRQNVFQAVRPPQRRGKGKFPGLGPGVERSRVTAIVTVK
jgi:hypothetical protein